MPAMRWLPVLLVLAGGCGVFSSEDSPTTPGPDAGGNGDAGADGPMSVGGPAAPLFALGPVTMTTSVVHGTTAKVAISITREIGFTDPVQITTKNLRDGITSAPLAITTDRGDLEITVPAAAAPGAADGVIEATGGGVTRTTPFSLLVRGKPGEVDTSYGAKGYASGIFGAPASSQADPFDAKLAADDSVYVLGHQGGLVVAAHVLADGTLDKSYGTAGVANIGVNLARAAALQPDGKLVIVGGDSSGISIGRLDATGHPDATFGGATGTATLVPTAAIGGLCAGAYAVAVRNDGDIMVGFDNPVATLGGANRVAVARVTPAGALRTTFGAMGAARFAVGYLTAMTTRDTPGTASNGNVVVIWADQTPDPDVLGIYQANGDNAGTDTSFGGAKTVPVPVAERALNQRGAGLVTLPDQSIVAAVAGESGTAAMYLRKYDTSGNGVSGFGAAGLAGPFSPGSGSALGPLAIAAQSDGKILVAVARLDGSLQPAGQDAIRFTATGTVDTSFGQQGHVMNTVGDADVVLVQKSGRILLVGSGMPNSDVMVGGYWP